MFIGDTITARIEVIELFPEKKRVRLATSCRNQDDAVVLDGLRPLPHPSHMSIEEAVVVSREIGAAQTWLTHLTHLNDHAELEASLPAGVRAAHDGLRLKL